MNFNATNSYCSGCDEYCYDQNRNLSFCKINFGGLIYGAVEKKMELHKLINHFRLLERQLVFDLTYSYID